MNLFKIIRAGIVGTILILQGLGISILPPEHIQNIPTPKWKLGEVVPQNNKQATISGYIATKGYFTAVSGTWTVADLQKSSNGKASSTWIGIGGVTSEDLIQTGTKKMVDQNGKVFYQAFFGTLSKPSSFLQLDIKTGDSVSASIVQQGKRLWQISFKNNTTGQSVLITEIHSSSLSSAEWIEETSKGYPKTAQFTDAKTVKNGQTLNPAQAKAQAIMSRFGASNEFTASI